MAKKKKKKVKRGRGREIIKRKVLNKMLCSVNIC